MGIKLTYGRGAVRSSCDPYVGGAFLVLEFVASLVLCLALFSLVGTFRGYQAFAFSKLDLGFGMILYIMNMLGAGIVHWFVARDNPRGTWWIVPLVTASACVGLVLGVFYLVTRVLFGALGP